ncbi:MAG: DUF222 domain-containing protein [bacterium]
MTAVDVDTEPAADAVTDAVAEPLISYFRLGVLGVDPDSLSDSEQIDRLVLLERLKARLDAEQILVLACLDARDKTPEHFVVEDVRLALRLSRTAAAARLDDARLVATGLPATLGLLTTGAITSRHVAVTCEAARRVPPDRLPDLEAVADRRVREQTPAELARTLRRAVLVVDPSGAERRRTAAMGGRRLVAYPDEDGMANLVFTGRAEDVEAVFGRIDAATRLLPADDPRSVDQQRADMFVDAVLSGIPADGLPMQHGRRPAVEVRVDLSTLLGLDNRPGELGGYGPITAAAARELAGDPTGTWRRILTDPASGAPLDVGRRTYRPPRPLGDVVAARDRTCAFPGCAQSAGRCQLDHVLPFNRDDPDAGGATEAKNLVPLCGRHHDLKTKQHVSYRREPGGAFVWRTRTGHTYRTRPPDEWADPPSAVIGGHARVLLTTTQHRLR